MLFSFSGQAQKNKVKSTENCFYFTNQNADNVKVEWNGNCKEGYIHGKGKLSFYSKGKLLYKFKGKINKGKMDNGRLTFTDGYYSEGSFVNGRLEGNGKRKFAYNTEWETYEGEFKNSKLHGIGKLTYKKTSSIKKYEGNFSDGYKSGKGKMIYKNGDYYEGEWFPEDQVFVGDRYKNKKRIKSGYWVGTSHEGTKLEYNKNQNKRKDFFDNFISTEKGTIDNLEDKSLEWMINNTNEVANFLCGYYKNNKRYNASGGVEKKLYDITYGFNRAIRLTYNMNNSWVSNCKLAIKEIDVLISQYPKYGNLYAGKAVLYDLLANNNYEGMEKERDKNIALALLLQSTSVYPFRLVFEKNSRTWIDHNSMTREKLQYLKNIQQVARPVFYRTSTMAKVSNMHSGFFNRYLPFNNGWNTKKWNASMTETIEEFENDSERLSQISIVQNAEKRVKELKEKYFAKKYVIDASNLSYKEVFVKLKEHLRRPEVQEYIEALIISRPRYKLKFNTYRSLGCEVRTFATDEFGQNPFKINTGFSIEQNLTKADKKLINQIKNNDNFIVASLSGPTFSIGFKPEIVGNSFENKKYFTTDPVKSCFMVEESIYGVNYILRDNSTEEMKGVYYIKNDTAFNTKSLSGVYNPEKLEKLCAYIKDNISELGFEDIKLDFNLEESLLRSKRNVEIVLLSPMFDNADYIWEIANDELGRKQRAKKTERVREENSNGVISYIGMCYDDISGWPRFVCQCPDGNYLIEDAILFNKDDDTSYAKKGFMKKAKEACKEPLGRTKFGPYKGKYNTCD